MTAEIFVNGEKLICHKGGYSTFRVNITPVLKEGENLLAVRADNGKKPGGVSRKRLILPFTAASTAMYTCWWSGGSFRIGA